MTRGRDPGFTLVEVLAALALTGLVSLILFQGIRLAAAGFDRLAAEAERLDERRGLATALRRNVGAAMLAPVRGGAFDGRADRLAFLAAAEDAGPGLYAVEIAIDTAQPDRPLVLTRRVARAAAAAARNDSILARRVRSLRIAYFGVAGPGADPAWTDTWQGLGILPRFVRLTIDTGDAALAPPPILIRLWNAG